MVKKLEHLNWKPMWTSHLGCIKGCIDYLGLDISDAWLFGGTGHAFIINMHDEMCPSGPTAWNTKRIFKLGRNLGYEIEGVCGHKSGKDFAENQKKSWELVKKSIDEGVPCYGWELDIPEFYVISGYDDKGYHYSGPLAQPAKMPAAWEKVADTGIGWLEMYAVKPGKPADDVKTVKDAFEFAIKHATTREWLHDKYYSGPEGFDAWIKALETDKTTTEGHGHGIAYNAEVWRECRSQAVDFLAEAKERLAKPELDALFDEAISHYDVVTRKLGRVENLFPFHTRKPSHIKEAERRKKAITALEAARDAEAKGLEALGKIAKIL